jgi:hypothetical protein
LEGSGARMYDSARAVIVIYSSIAEIRYSAFLPVPRGLISRLGGQQARKMIRRDLVNKMIMQEEVSGAEFCRHFSNACVIFVLGIFICTSMAPQWENPFTSWSKSSLVSQ